MKWGAEQFLSHGKIGIKTREYTISWPAWIIIGGVAGWLAGMVMHSGLGLIGDIVVGIIGAFIGGWLFTKFGMPGVTGFNFYTLGVSVVGAVVLLFVFSLFWRRRASA